MAQRAMFRPSAGIGGLVLPLALLACGGQSDGEVSSLVITLAPEEVTLLAGGILRVTADVRDRSGAPRPDAPLAWSASDRAIASVDSDGVVVAYRGGVVVITAMSGTARGRATVQVAPFDLTALEVRPSAAKITVGGAVRLEEVAHNAAGIVVTELPIDWRSLAPVTATVGADGLVRGAALGITTIRGTVAGMSADATVTVSDDPGPAEAWPNEPAGYTAISDQPWDTVGTLGWTMQFGEATITQDAAAPRSPPRILTFTYPVGFAGGSAPATAARAFAPARGVFTGVWWKVSDPWQGHESNVNKLLFLFPEGGGDITLVMYGPPGGPYELRAIPQFPGLPSRWLRPNVASIPVTLGTWHRVEWLVEMQEGTGVGTVRWWLDGRLIGDHRRVPFPEAGMIECKLSPTWGGVDDRKRGTDHFWIDHAYLSRR